VCERKRYPGPEDGWTGAEKGKGDGLNLLPGTQRARTFASLADRGGARSLPDALRYQTGAAGDPAGLIRLIPLPQG
jgi:hypothetical protein